ncbi:hypothetical protein THAOC_09430, partial [Thalassiosira oceanica]
MEKDEEPSPGELGRAVRGNRRGASSGRAETMAVGLIRGRRRAASAVPRRSMSDAAAALAGSASADAESSAARNLQQQLMESGHERPEDDR